MAFGVVAKIYNLLLPFVMRTLLIYTLGMAYTGLNSLFTSILSVAEPCGARSRLGDDIQYV